jgi:hypothetical protein
MTIEERRKYQKDWREKNRDYYTEYQKEWRKNHPNYSKERYQALKAGKMRPTIFSRIKAITPAFFRNLVKGGK